MRRTQRHPQIAAASLVLAVAVLVSACASGAVPTPAPTKPAPAASPTAATQGAARPAATPSAKAGPTTPATAAAPAAKPTTIKVGTLSASSDGPIYIAQDRGYFRQEGLTVEIVPFSSSPLMIAPLSTGELDVGTGTISVAVLNAIERGVNLKVVADKGSSNEQFVYSSIVLRKDLADSGAVKTAKDLKGRKAGLSALQSGVEANLWFVLNSGGLTTSDMEIVQLGYPETIVALRNKAIDVGFLIEPFQTQAVEQGVAVLWPPGYHHRLTGGVTQGSALMYSEPLVRNGDLGMKFMLAYTKGVREYNDAFLKGKNKAEVVSLLIQNTSAKDPALYEKAQLPYINPDGKVDIYSMQLTLDYFRKMGYYTGKLELDRVIDNQFVEYAMSKLGKYQ